MRADIFCESGCLGLTSTLYSSGPIIEGTINSVAVFYNNQARPKSMLVIPGGSASHEGSKSCAVIISRLRHTVSGTEISIKNGRVR